MAAFAMRWQSLIRFNLSERGPVLCPGVKRVQNELASLAEACEVAACRVRDDGRLAASAHLAQHLN